MKVFSIRSIVSTTMALLATCSLGYLSGIKNSLDISIVEQAKDVYFDEIIKLINNLELPDIYLPDDKGYMIGNKFVLMESSSDVQFTTDVQDNAVVFEVTDFKGTFYCDHFRYKELLLVAKGSI